MKYLLIIDGFGRFADFAEYARVFSAPVKAKNYVSDLHGESWDSKKQRFKDGVDWDGALLYQMNMDGTLTLIDEYDTISDASGFARGWIGVK